MSDSLNLGTLYTSYELRLQKLDQGIREAEGKLRAFGKRTEEQAKSWGQNFERAGKALSIAVAAPLAALGVAALQTATKMDSLKRGLTAVAGSSAEAERQLKRLKEVAKLPGLGFQEAVQGAIRLQAAGLSAQQAERSLRGFGNAIATVGGGKAELDGVAIALGQMATKGKVFAEELNQLQERVPQIRQVMKEAFGTASTEEIAKMGITASQFIDRVNTELLKMPQVVGGAQNSFENLQDSVKRALTVIGEVFLPTIARAADAAASVLETLAEKFQALPQTAREALVGGAGLAGMLAVATLGVGKMIAEIEKLRGTLAGGFILNLGIVVSVTAAMVAASEGLADLMARILPMPKGVTEGMQGLVTKGHVVTPRERRLAQSRLNQQLDAEARRGMQEGRIAISQVGKGVRPLDPMAMNIRLTGGGQYARLLQDMETVEKRIKETQGKIGGAVSNADRNQLGTLLQQLEQRRILIEGMLKVYDPAEQKRMQEEARKKAEQLRKSTEKNLLSMMGTVGGLMGREGVAAFTQAKASQAFQEGAPDLFGAAAGGGIQSVGALLFAEDAPERYRRLDNALRNYVASVKEQAGDLVHTWTDMQDRVVEQTRRSTDFMRGGPGRPSDFATMLFGHTEAAKQQVEEIVSGIIEGAVEGAAKKGGLRAGFDFLSELFYNLGEEAANAFGDGMRKIFGSNPFGRAIARTLDRWLGSMIDSLITSFLPKIQGLGQTQQKGGFGVGDLINMGLGTLIPGGGLLATGVDALLGGVGDLFGFDDPKNDAKAFKWGADFGRLFSQGAMAGAGRSVQMAGAGGGGDVHVHLSGPISITNDMDVRRLGQQLGREIQLTRPARGGRRR